MGFMAASASFSRFRVTEPVSESLWAEIPNLLKEFAFRDIDHTADERSFGWVSFEDMLDTSWSQAAPYKGTYVVFGLRLDTRRISPAVMKKHFTVALNAEKETLKERGIKYVSRDRKKEIKENVRLQLLSRSFPIPALFDVVWNTEANLVYFGSINNKVIDMFGKLFATTFNTHVELLTPHAAALHFLGAETGGELDQPEPTRFI